MHFFWVFEQCWDEVRFYVWQLGCNVRVEIAFQMSNQGFE
jgi:hypothetical protein